MKMSIRLAVAIGALLLSAEAGSAASMQYCKLYAREYTDIVGPKLLEEPGEGTREERLQRLLNQSYAKCLNQDEEPELPTAGAFSGDEAANVVEPDPAIIGEGDADPMDEAVEEPVTPPPAKRKTTVAGKYRGSGMKAWTPEWVAWCKEHYRSFDAKTGYVRPHSGEPMLCP